MLRTEMDAYLSQVPTLDQSLPTRCPGWTIGDITKHLAATFERFRRMLDQGRGGDFTPPFGHDEMDAENNQKVKEFTGDADAALREWAEHFFAAATDPAEEMPHQRGTIPVGMQQVFALMDLTMHHDDCAVAAGLRYTPPTAVVAALYSGFDTLGGWEDTDLRDGTWDGLVHDSGRHS